MAEKNHDPVHTPVMADEVVASLVTDRHGVYVDLTAGTGGHLLAIVSALADDARLYGVDLDAQALEVARQRLKDVRQVKELVHASYVSIDELGKRLVEDGFDGILLDLGLSTKQLDSPERGFSHRFKAPLDMRFDSSATRPTAADLVNRLSQRELTQIFRDFGQERQAARLAKAILRERDREMILTTDQLSELVRRTIRTAHLNKTLARVFQALRIAVNNELEQLRQVLQKAIDALKAGGRLGIITYHSLEDRSVKHFFRQAASGCTCPPRIPMCVCGGLPQVEVLTRRAIIPSAEEVAANSRARSAKFRVVEKLAT